MNRDDKDNNLIAAGAVMALLFGLGDDLQAVTSVEMVTDAEGNATNQIDITLSFMLSPYRITVERVVDADTSGPKHTGLFASMSDN